MSTTPTAAPRDHLRDLARRGRLDWSSFRETGGGVRERLQYDDQRVAVRALLVAGSLCLVRGLVMPAVLTLLHGDDVPAQWAAYLHPITANASICLGILLVAGGLLARRVPLLAGAVGFFAALGTIGATFYFVPGAVERAADLHYIPMLGRVLLLGLCGRAVFAGLQHHLR